MTRSEARERLLAAAADPSADIGEAALWIAVEDLPGVDHPRPWLERLDALAGELVRGEEEASADALASLFRSRLQLRGAGGGDPRTHYLTTVLNSGVGTPLSWGAIWIAVGRRAGIAVQGVPLPGHFAVRVAGRVVDPFSGDPLAEDDLRLIASRHLGREPERLEPHWLDPAGNRRILARMSRNLRGCYASLESWPLALQAADRCVDLLPDQPAGYRDRGLLLWRMGQPQGALCDLNRYLVMAPAEAADRSDVGEVVGRLRAFLN